MEVTGAHLFNLWDTNKDLAKQRDILKVENEALRGIIEDLQRKRLEEIDELKAMRAMITDLRVQLSAIYASGYRH